MSHSSNNAYKSAGVDTEAGQTFVSRIKASVESTHLPFVMGGLGGFNAAIDVSFLKNYEHPILLSGTDGVGTKLEIARQLDYHSTVGIDLVAMCVNDILVSGGKPLFFLDYIATGKLDLPRMEQIVSGIVEGCKQANCSLVGGETAEHPGLMEADEYDLAGFVVGCVEKSKMIDGSKVKPGDVVLGIPSSGPHSNGFSLIRKLFLPDGKLPKNSNVQDFIKNHLMKPTKIYVNLIQKILGEFSVHAMVHITGGGFFENIPRPLPKGMGVQLNSSLIPKLECFSKIEKDFSLSHQDLYSTFNMGIGFLVILPQGEVDRCIEVVQKQGESLIPLGKVTDTGRIEID